MRMKYKIWDKQEKKWFEAINNASEGELEQLFLNQSGELIRRTMNGFEHESLFPDRFQISYYTGFYDIDGKEIYDRDILQENKTIGVYQPGRCVSVYFSFSGRWMVRIGTVTDQLRESAERSKRIGTVYENPELVDKSEVTST